MRTKIFAALLGAVLVGAGCVSTVNEKSTAGVPFLKDRIEGRYDRPLDQVFKAAKDVVMTDGALLHEGTSYSSQTNAFQTIEGKVNQRKVWIRVEAVNPTITSVTVQARTKGGGADVELAAQLDKEIALRLAGK
ncbi:MAG TPA: DUF3568 family protein [Candidatus Binatia bacterium]|jgi:hypothetical protein|nr:DUF3568 family protein [Candidatus Binatia bacterium]